MLHVAQGATIPVEDPESPWSERRHFLCYEGLLGELPPLHYGMIFSFLYKHGLWCQTRLLNPTPSMTKIIFEMPTFPRLLIFKTGTLVYQTVLSPPPPLEIVTFFLIKNNQNMKLNKKQFNISYLNTKAKQSSKYFIK